MAKTFTRRPRKPTPINSNVAVEEPTPDVQDAIPPAFQQPAAETPADSAAPRQEAKIPKTPTFYQTIAKIPKADWGARANIYLYRVEPIIDRTRSGDTKFVNVYAEPINEDRIMADYGSGRYKLILNFRKAGADMGDIMDSVYMDILNMKYPPKIPLGEWTDDPRNKKWAWAKEALGIPNANTPTAAPMDPLAAFGTFMDIQDRVQERLTPTATAAPAQVDPWAAAEKILNMRSDNPMVEILKEQMKASSAAAEAERDRAFKAAESAREREFKLQEKLLEAKNSAAPPKTIIEQLIEIATNADKLEPLKKIFGAGAEAVGRTARTTGWDMARDIVQSPFGANLGQGLGMLLSNLADRGAQANPAPAPRPAPVVLNAQQPNGTTPPVEPPEQRINRIGQTITHPMLYEFFLKDEQSGEAFAERMFDLWPEDYIFIRQLGPDALVARYRQFGPAWAIIGPKEPAFIQFISDFCKWDPNEQEEPDEPPASNTAGITDLDTEAAS